MITLTLSKIRPNEDISKTTLGFSKDYLTKNNVPCHGGDELIYPEAIRIFQALNLIQQSSILTERVTVLSSKAKEIADRLKTALDTYIWGNYEAVQKEILGSDLYGFKIYLEGERYQDNPFDQLLCELAALEKGVEYSAPTVDQFHRYVAKHLATFAVPFKHNEHLITQTDLRNHILSI